MTPDELIAQVGRLVASGRDQDALDLAAGRGGTVEPGLSFDQLDQIGGLLEGAAMAVEMSKAAAAPVRGSKGVG